MSGFGTARQGIPEFNPVAITILPVESLPGVSPYASATQPLFIDPSYAPFNKDAVSGTQAPCSFSGRGAPVCGSEADLAGSAAKVERVAKQRAPLFLGAALVAGLLLWRFA